MMLFAITAASVGHVTVRLNRSEGSGRFLRVFALALRDVYFG